MRTLPPDLERIIVTEEQIRGRVKEIAAEVSRDYAAGDGLCLIGVLKGAFIFLADLARELTVPHSVDFMALSSYGKATVQTSAVRIIMDLREPVEGRHVVLVEDIVDSGNTLGYLYATLKGRRPASIRTCVLLRKKRTAVDVPLSYLGFDIPDVWVVGYGLDYADQYRTLPYIAELKERVYRGR
jgi:hypoxanthine phosphoribosyltransferase